MINRRWLGASLAILLVAAACTGDDGDASDDLLSYFEQVEQITIDLQETNQGLPQTTDIESARVFFAAVNPAGDTALDQLSSLVPPDGAQASHDRLVELRGQYLALNQDIAERLDVIETTEEFTALASDQELGVNPQNALGNQVQAACHDHQAVADGEGIDVSLRCDTTG